MWILVSNVCICFAAALNTPKQELFCPRKTQSFVISQSSLFFNQKQKQTKSSMTQRSSGLWYFKVFFVLKSGILTQVCMDTTKTRLLVNTLRHLSDSKLQKAEAKFKGEDL